LRRVDRPLRRAMLALSRECAPLAIERRSARSTCRIDHPWPVFSLRAETSDNRILAYVSDLCRELFTALVITQSMIEEILLPDDVVLMSLEMLPVANYSTHGLAAREREERVNVIRHQQEHSDVPTLLRPVESRGIEQGLRERCRGDWPLLLLAIERDPDMKYGTGLDPVRNIMVQLGGKCPIWHTRDYELCV